MENKTTIILCAPRSGSSTLAGILSKLGVYMGRKKDLSKGTNPLGDYEDTDFKRLNYKILIDSGSCLNFLTLPSKSTVLGLRGKYDNKIRKLIAARKRYVNWGFKNGSWTPYTISLIHPHLPNPHYIVLTRNIQKIVKSYLRIKDGSIHYSLYRFLKSPELWNAKFIVRKILDQIIKRPTGPDILVKVFTGHNLTIEDFVKDKRHMLISFENLLESPHKTIDEIIKFLEIKPTKEQYLAALSFVHKDYIRF